MNQVATLPKRSLVDSMAARYDMEPKAFVDAVKATVIKGDCSNEQFAAFLMVAKEYDLNPLTKEIYAFPDRGGIQPIVSIDGWMHLINSHPQFDGMEFSDTTGDDGKLFSVECRMYRKDRQRHTSVIEYMSECFRPTDPWKKWPNRMLRHKAAIQCARYAFGFSGIMEPDEFDRMRDVTPAKNITPVFDPLSDEPIAPQRAADEREGFTATPTADEPHDALTGEILDSTDTDDSAPASSVDAGTQPAEGEVETPPAASPSTIPAEVRSHLIDLSRKTLSTLNDGCLDNEQKMEAIDDMLANYREAIEEEYWSKMATVRVSALAIMNGKRTQKQFASFMAEVLDCQPSDIGGSANG